MCIRLASNSNVEGHTPGNRGACDREGGSLIPSAELGLSELRSLRVHQAIASKLEPEDLGIWAGKIEADLDHIRQQVRGQPQLTNIDRWEELLVSRDLDGLRSVMTGLTRDSVEMRKVSPFRRLEVLSSREIVEVTDRKSQLRELTRLSQLYGEDD